MKIPVNGRGPDGKRVTVAWAEVDEEDYERASAMRWSLAGRGYARAGVRDEDGRFHSVYLHRLVLGDPVGLQVDHRNGDKLDCRRSNLRAVTNSQNHAGYSSKPPGASGERGVYLDRRRGTYEGRVVRQGVTYRKSGFATVAEAVEWRDRTGREVHGEHYFNYAHEGAEET